MTSVTGTTTSSSAAVPAASTASVGRTVLLLLAAVVVASVSGILVGVAAVAAGASATFPALTAVAIVPSVVVGVVVGYAGWRLVRRLSGASARVMRVVVPVVLLVSFTPDLILLATSFLPGASLTAVVALLIMHVIVVAVAVPVYQRVAPVR